jgi:hypothetical protein
VCTPHASDDKKKPLFIKNWAAQIEKEAKKKKELNRCHQIKHIKEWHGVQQPVFWIPKNLRWII